MGNKIKETEDGSFTLYNSDIEETYHSMHGAMSESMHVFIRHALERRLSAPVVTSLRLLEVGFGTGLNAWLTCRYLMEHDDCPPIEYHTYEIAPIEPALLPELFAELDEAGLALMQRLHEAPWNEPVEVVPGFVLFKHLEDVRHCNRLGDGSVDVIYMDAFSPENAPELWAEPFLRDLVAVARPGAVLATYCAKGVVRRTLQSVGFAMERTPGPPGGKREILVGLRQMRL